MEKVPYSETDVYKPKSIQWFNLDGFHISVFLGERTNTINIICKWNIHVWWPIQTLQWTNNSGIVVVKVFCVLCNVDFLYQICNVTFTYLACYFSGTFFSVGFLLALISWIDLNSKYMSIEPWLFPAGICSKSVM